MSVFDLKPLAAETIKDLKIKSDQLWEIKIDENIYGPFETHQLRHYSKENKQNFTRAFVSQMSVDNWRPFFEVREFIHEADYDGPYWILMDGRKSSPLSAEEIAKRVELGTIKRNNEISEDDGRHWHRISAHPVFEGLFTTGNTLPRLPQESSFQKSKQKVLEQLESKANWTEEKESIASLTHVSLARKEKTRTVQVENIKLTPEKPEQESFWESYRTHFYWAAPVIAIAVYFTIGTPKTKTELTTVEPEEKSQTTGKTRSPKSKDRWSRSPANDGSDYNDNRSAVTQTPPGDDNYPTVIETHQDDQNYPDPDKEADQVAEIQDQEDKSEEHSLVQQQRPNRDPAQDGGESLDATMNNEPQEQPNPAVDQPVVEEVSDF